MLREIQGPNALRHHSTSSTISRITWEDSRARSVRDGADDKLACAERKVWTQERSRRDIRRAHGPGTVGANEGGGDDARQPGGRRQVRRRTGSCGALIM